MCKTKELKIDSTLCATPSKLVDLLDFKPDKISIKTKSNTKNDSKVHHIRYENGGFYLIFGNLEDYFDFNNNVGSLNMLFVDNNKKSKYYRVRKEILKIINGGHGELKSCKEIKLFYDDLPIGHVFKIHSMTIAVRSVVEKDNKFYPQISLNHCSYEV